MGFTPDEFHYAFTNTLTEQESREVWDRYDGSLRVVSVETDEAGRITPPPAGPAQPKRQPIRFHCARNPTSTSSPTTTTVWCTLAATPPPRQAPNVAATVATTSAT